jgi:hypothetical protein
MVALIIRPASPWTHNTTISDMVLFFREDPHRARRATPSADTPCERIDSQKQKSTRLPSTQYLYDNFQPTTVNSIYLR